MEFCAVLPILFEILVKIWQNDGEKPLDKEGVFRYNKSRSLKLQNIYALGGNYE